MQPLEFRLLYTALMFAGSIGLLVLVCWIAERRDRKCRRSLERSAGLPHRRKSRIR